MLFFRKISLASAAAFCAVFVSSVALTQTSGEDKPRLKDFGSSLKDVGKKRSPALGAKVQIAVLAEEGTISIRTDLVINNVLVLDTKGKEIVGLRAEDLVVTENGKEQKIAVFSYGENAVVPRSFVVIIENSWSIYPYREATFSAAARLVDKLGPQDRMAIVNDRVELLANFTNDKRLLKEKLERERREAQMDYRKYGFDRGNGLQFSALLATLRELFEDDLVPIVIFQTDGKELMVLKPALPGYKDAERNFGLHDVLEEVQRSRATIYSMVIGPRIVGVTEDEYQKSVELMNRTWAPHNPQWLRFVKREQQALVDVANLSGGYADFIERPEDTQRVYATLLEAINRRYLIGYYSDAPNDGRRRSVKVEVRGHPEYVVIGRKTYVAR